MVLIRMTQVLLLVVLIGLTGCSTTRSVILHPIEKSDIFYIPKGTQVGDGIVEKDGYFLSNYYLEEVAKARVK